MPVPFKIVSGIIYIHPSGLTDSISVHIISDAPGIHPASRLIAFSVKIIGVPFGNHEIVGDI